jgi:hypothetical protein
MTPNNKSEGRSFFTKLLLATIIVVVVGGLIVGGITLYNIYNNPSTRTEEVLQFEGIFVDINGDGLDDYVRYAEVVINKGDFTVSP